MLRLLTAGDGRVRNELQSKEPHSHVDCLGWRLLGIVALLRRATVLSLVGLRGLLGVGLSYVNTGSLDG